MTMTPGMPTAKRVRANRTGASIMGARMFDGGEHRWPEEAPFHTPVFVLTKEVRLPWASRSPRFSSAGIRLFDGVHRGRISVDMVEAIHSPVVVHLSYTVRRW